MLTYVLDKTFCHGNAVSLLLDALDKQNFEQSVICIDAVNKKTVREYVLTF